jgi:hypothetical protein
VLHVIEREQRAAGLAGVDAVLVDADRRIGADAEIADADAAQRIARLGCLLAADGEARNVAVELGQVVACSDSICFVVTIWIGIGTSCTSCVRLCAVTVTLPSCAASEVVASAAAGAAAGAAVSAASASAAGLAAANSETNAPCNSARRRDTTNRRW